MKNVMMLIIAIAWMFILDINVVFSKETIKIAVGNWPPYLSEKMEHKGIVAQIITEIFSAEGYNVEFRFFPWARAYVETKQGSFDCTGVWLKKPEREADFYYSDPVIKEKTVFFHLKDFKFDWNKIDDLYGLKIGGIIRFSYGEEFDNDLKLGKIKVDRTSTDVQNFKKLLAKRLDIYPQEINIAYNVLRSDFKPEEIQLITYHPKTLMENESYLLFPKNVARSKVLIKIFNKNLKHLKDSGKYQQYFDINQNTKHIED